MSVDHLFDMASHCNIECSLMRSECCFVSYSNERIHSHQRIYVYPCFMRPQMSLCTTPANRDMSRFLGLTSRAR